MIVPVNSSDIEICNDFCNRFEAVKSCPVSVKNGRCNAFAGKLVEIVAGRVYGVPVDLNVYPGKDCGSDAVIGGKRVGFRAVQVLRRTDYDFGLILRPHEVQPDVLVLALVYPAKDYVEFVGWLPINEFLRLAVPAPDEWRYDTPAMFSGNVDRPMVVPRSLLWSY